MCVFLSQAIKGSGVLRTLYDWLNLFTLYCVVIGGKLISLVGEGVEMNHIVEKTKVRL